MEPWTYLSSAINCTGLPHWRRPTAATGLPRWQQGWEKTTLVHNNGLEDLFLLLHTPGCCDAADLCNFGTNTSMSKKRLRRRHYSARWKALKISTGN